MSCSGGGRWVARRSSPAPTLTSLRYEAGLQERSAGTPHARVAFRGEISPWMAGGAGIYPLAPQLERWNWIAVIEGENDIKDRIHGHLVFTLYFHSIRCAQGVAARLKSKHDCELDAGQREPNVETCFWCCEKSKRANVGKYWINKPGWPTARWALLMKAFSVITDKLWNLPEMCMKYASAAVRADGTNSDSCRRFLSLPPFTVSGILSGCYFVLFRATQAAKCQAIVCSDKDVRAAF